MKKRQQSYMHSLFDVQRFSAERQAIIPPHIKHNTILLVRNIHMLVIRTECQASCLLFVYWRFEYGKEITIGVSTMNSSVLATPVDAKEMMNQENKNMRNVESEMHVKKRQW